MRLSPKQKSSPVTRISISLPDDLQTEVDLLVEQRGFRSRSHAINDMLRQHVAEHKHQQGDQVMVGTITLLYKNTTPGLSQALADVQYRYLDEVISSLHVQLADSLTMEVILVQGPANDLQRIADTLITLRGVVTGRLQVMAALIPPLHPMPASPMPASPLPARASSHLPG